MEKHNNFLSIIDLFAGCGGLSLGFEQAGFTPIFVNELNSNALDTYLSNRHHSLGGLKFSENPELHSKDAHELKGKRLEQLKSDLSSISEVDIKFPKVNARNASMGSTIDVLAGGPPCQGYSGIGFRRSYEVERQDIPANQLYIRMIRIIKNLKPRIFLFENVRGIMTSSWYKGGTRKIYEDVLESFRSIRGYEVRWNLVKSYDYGVPQNRPRFILVGIRKDVLKGNQTIDKSADPDDAIKCGFLPGPKNVFFDFPNIVDVIGDLEDDRIYYKLLAGDHRSLVKEHPKGLFASPDYPKDAMTEIQEKLREPRSVNDPAVKLTDHEYSRHKTHVVKRFRHMIENNGQVPDDMKINKFAQRVLKARWGDTLPGITIASLPDDYVHYSQPRTLTVREWARLQLFPDWYKFKGPRTTGGLRRAGNPREKIFDRELPKYTQIGNAVPVELARRIGSHFKNIIDEYIGQ